MVLTVTDSNQAATEEPNEPLWYHDNLVTTFLASSEAMRSPTGAGAASSLREMEHVIDARYQSGPDWCRRRDTMTVNVRTTKPVVATQTTTCSRNSQPVRH